MRVQSRCISCGKLRPCVKVEARAPLDEPVLAWDEETESHYKVEYELYGPMVELCRDCLEAHGGTLGAMLLEDL